MTTDDRPILHVVTWRLNGSTPEERKAQADRIVIAFKGTEERVPGLLRLEVGRNFIEADDAWDVGLCMVFASRAALDAYLAHPDHLAIKTLVGPLRKSRCQVDFELNH